MKYNLENLKEINACFCGSHVLHDSDVDMANRYVERIERSRREYPQIGDIVEFTNKYGDYYSSAHIEIIGEDGHARICEQPYVPFVSNYGDGIACCTSGGAWSYIPIAEMSLIGKREKWFCDFGSCGACANGAVEFKAMVNVWKYNEANIYIDKDGMEYTTKDFNKMIIDYIPESRRDEWDYSYKGKNIAWKTELELQTWLRANRAVVFPGNYHSMVVWYWKEIRHALSPLEFDALDFPEDTLLHNGSILRCKRRYDESTHTIHTYWVWYWGNPDRDYAMQNEIREKYYTLDRKTPVNWYTLNEIKSGKVKAYDISFLRKDE